MIDKLKGTGVALVTPFLDDESIDFDGLSRILSHCIEGGVDYFVVLGTTGETAVLSLSEKRLVVKHVVDYVNGRKPIVLGIGGNCTKLVIESYNDFDLTGITAILTVSPYYNKPTQEGIYQHYKKLSESFDLPIILYNVPGRTASNITAETTLRLAHDFENIVAVKEASGNLNQVMDIINRKPNDFLVLSGDDGITLPMILMGADGVISVVGQAYPNKFSSMVKSALKGMVKESNQFHYQLFDLYEPLYKDGNPAGVKECMSLLGICKNNLRLPLVNVTADTHEKLKKTMNF